MTKAHTISLNTVRDIQQAAGLTKDAIKTDHPLPPTGATCLALVGTAANLAEFVMAADRALGHAHVDDTLALENMGRVHVNDPGPVTFNTEVTWYWPFIEVE